jgi:hypothetical protein
MCASGTACPLSGVMMVDKEEDDKALLDIHTLIIDSSQGADLKRRSLWWRGVWHRLGLLSIIPFPVSTYSMQGST